MKHDPYIPPQKKHGKNWQYYLGFIGEIGFTITIPIVVGLLIGKYIDNRWNFYPKATVSGLLLGLVISIMNLVRTVQAIIKDS